MKKVIAGFCILSFFIGALFDRVLLASKPTRSSDATRTLARASMLRSARNALNDGNSAQAKFLVDKLFQDDITIIRNLRGLSGRELNVQQKLLNEVGK